MWPSSIAPRATPGQTIQGGRQGLIRCCRLKDFRCTVARHDRLAGNFLFARALVEILCFWEIGWSRCSSLHWLGAPPGQDGRANRQNAIFYWPALPPSVGGFSMGATINASRTDLVGCASNLRRVADSKEMHLGRRCRRCRGRGASGIRSVEIGQSCAAATSGWS